MRETPDGLREVNWGPFLYYGKAFPEKNIFHWNISKTKHDPNLQAVWICV